MANVRHGPDIRPVSAASAASRQAGGDVVAEPAIHLSLTPPTTAAGLPGVRGRACPSWYYASVSTSTRPEAVRRQVRWAVRAVASQDPDTPERQRKCGVVSLGDGVQIRVKDGAYFCGLTTCGSVWRCTVCSAKVRATRADELVRALEAHYAAGGAVHLLTMTVAHDKTDRLARLLGSPEPGKVQVPHGLTRGDDKAFQ